MTDDGQQCFAYLKKNAPRWISALTSLERHIDGKRKSSASVSDKVLEAFETGGSVTSTSTRAQVEGNGIRDSLPSSTIDITVQNGARNRTIYPKRKKNLGSISSTVGSGPSNSRSRTMVVVYYDVEIQKVFEDVVWEIGYGRNLVRKAKMAATMDALTGALSDGSDFGISADGDIPPLFKIASFRRAGQRGPAARSDGDAAAEAGPTALERADKALEDAQSACERGAHRFLRDGECRSETETAKGAFGEILKVSTEELPRLEAMKRAKTRESQKSPTEAARTEQLGTQGQTHDRNSNGMEFGTIEVDDSEDQMPLELPTLRMISRMGPRRGFG